MHIFLCRDEYIACVNEKNNSPKMQRNESANHLEVNIIFGKDKRYINSKNMSIDVQKNIFFFY